MLRLLAAPLLLWPLAATAAEPVPLPEGEMVEWTGWEQPEQVFTAGDLTLTLAVSGDSADLRATLEVERPGAAPAMVEGRGSGGGIGLIGVFPFEPGGRTVLFATWTGGAHCCMQIEAVTDIGGRLVTSAVGTFDGDLITPEDIDDDGTYELPRRDDRFNYQFEAYAGSFPPPLVLKSRDGSFYDATDDPRYASVLDAEMAEAKQYCTDEQLLLGPCSAVLAIAARRGTYAAEMARIEAALAAGVNPQGWDDFSFCLDDECKEQTTFTSFPEAIDYALRLWGYLPPR